MGLNERTPSSENTESPLGLLKVIDRLEVGPVRIEPRRLAANYRVVRGDNIDTNELRYRYEEDVFDPENPQDLNLASVIAAQVAVNYGLFCDEIIFHGPFDKVDQRLLKETAQNTAREIYVKKFLEENPFLVGPAAELPVIKQNSYLQSRLVFPDLAPTLSGKSFRTAGAGWGTERGRHAVLSSGGKDSLLSYGLLREIGCEVHPLFVNESGRHWFTALNAHRHFAENVAETSRVWTNSDRLFNWMLRQFSFIRKDYNQLRADIYPIRLWTVAVFLFGVLPLMRKRGVSRLVIGDEFDSTQRLSYKGITHYDGIYDQSRYFDNVMSRYFQAKNWHVSQFSILRPLSELLIEKILVERYPELQTLQMSCHATHKEGERVHPCGRCEKCRRIVGMLTALGADPGRCGYSPAQVTDCLSKLAQKGVHQEAAGLQQLLYLLRERKRLPTSAAGIGRIRARPEIMQLRFDPERSPMNSIPADLRFPLYQIYLDHADGAVRRQGRLWLEVDSLNDPAARRPYAFDHPMGAAGLEGTENEQKTSPERSDFLLGQLTWPEARDRFRAVDVALLPVGAIEQHGPHLPLDTDAFDADYLAKEVARACSEPWPLVLPLIPYGVSYHHQNFPGTFSISPDTLSKIVYEVGMSAARNGITKLLIINGHGGNAPALHFAAQMINRDAHIFTCVDTGETSDPDVNALATTPNDVHAGEIETSTTLAVRPELVQMKEAVKFIPQFSSRYLNFTSKRSIGWYAHVAKLSPSGVLGDPTMADRKKGEKMWALMIEHLVHLVEDLKNLSLDEIHQKWY